MSAAARLYVVTRRDLGPGQQAAQSCHALRLFAEEHPDVERDWYRRSNCLVIVAVADEGALERLREQARCRGLPASAFREPDLGEALTAVALGPGEGARSLCRRLPLALGP